MTRNSGIPIFAAIIWTLACLFILVGVDHGVKAASPAPQAGVPVGGGPWGYKPPRRKSSSSSSGDTESSPGSLCQWLSNKLFSVDPSGILSLLISHGNFWIPDNAMIPDLEKLFQVCHAEEVNWNVVERELVIHNFTINVPGDDQDALHISRVFFKWDSYLQPCLDIEVDNVTILVDFADMMMTRTNWDELKRHGFPPKLPPPPEEEFLRVGSIDLSGDICATLQSRPLQKEIAIIKLDMDSSLLELDMDIRRRSEENLDQFGKRGCTPQEVFHLIQAYVDRKSKQILEGQVDMDTTSVSPTATTAIDPTSSEEFVFLELVVDPTLTKEENTMSTRNPRNTETESSPPVKTRKSLAQRMAGRIHAASRSILEYPIPQSQPPKARHNSSPPSQKRRNRGNFWRRFIANPLDKKSSDSGDNSWTTPSLGRLTRRLTRLFGRLVQGLFFLVLFRHGSPASGSSTSSSKYFR